ncbi:MAG: hypothetical protein E7460_10200 [Ruminococcaceae bacterium]|nr:hypothetical protein [Oscillospiraceae bacterium]MBQ8898920.1 hypothetical protein [Clostridia bacterium]
MNVFAMFSNLIYALTAETTGAASGVLSGLTFEPMNFVRMLSYMGKGMLVIFVLIGVIILVTLLINKVFSRKK